MVCVLLLLGTLFIPLGTCLISINNNVGLAERYGLFIIAYNLGGCAMYLLDWVYYTKPRKCAKER